VKKIFFALSLLSPLAAFAEPLMISCEGRNRTSFEIEQVGSVMNPEGEIPSVFRYLANGTVLSTYRVRYTSMLGKSLDHSEDAYFMVLDLSETTFTVVFPSNSLEGKGYYRKGARLPAVELSCTRNHLEPRLL
jgi:hypothetical protein